MHRLAIDTTDVTLKRNQSVLLTEILGEVVSSFGGLFLQVVASNFNFHLREWIVQSSRAAFYISGLKDKKKILIIENRFVFQNIPH